MSRAPKPAVDQGSAVEWAPRSLNMLRDRALGLAVQSFGPLTDQGSDARIVDRAVRFLAFLSGETTGSVQASVSVSGAEASPPQ